MFNRPAIVQRFEADGWCWCNQDSGKVAWPAQNSKKVSASFEKRSRERTNKIATLVLQRFEQNITEESSQRFTAQTRSRGARHSKYYPFWNWRISNTKKSQAGQLSRLWFKGQFISLCTLWWWFISFFWGVVRQMRQIWELRRIVICKGVLKTTSLNQKWNQVTMSSSTRKSASLFGILAPQN